MKTIFCTPKNIVDYKIQVIKKLGARVIATASKQKHSFLLDQGVEVVFDSRTTDFSNEILEYTNGKGGDIVLNSLNFLEYPLCKSCSASSFLIAFSSALSLALSKKKFLSSLQG